MKSFAKINIFLKIVGTRGDFHELSSRFVLVENLYDELFLVPKRSDVEFELGGDFDCEPNQNIITKAYYHLKSLGYDLSDLFGQNALHVEKNIPSGAGLGGGSSNCASFLHLCNDKLGLPLDELMSIGAQLGSDVPFFISGAKSANVSGVGENIASFNDVVSELEIITPDIFCSTKEVYTIFREHFLDSVDVRMSHELHNQTSEQILKNYDPSSLNDLLNPAMILHEELRSFVEDGWFMSGSGSSMFRIKR